MSGWIIFVLVALGVFGQPSGNASGGGKVVVVFAFAYVAWALVMIALILAVVVDAKGWP